MDNLRVLIIESEPSVRIDVRDALRRFGPELFEASNVDEAKIFLSRVAFDVIVLSMDLEDDSSKTFLATLPDLLHTPYEVILLTKSRDARVRESYFELGISHLLMKPIDYQNLGYVVRNASMIRARLRYLEEATLGEVDDANQEVDRLSQELEALKIKLESRDALLANLASLSHDFRTPLQVIVGFSELLLGTHLSPEQVEWTESIRRSGGDILSLVREFLELQSSPDLSTPAASGVVDIKRFLENQVQMSRVLVGNKTLKLSFEYSDAAPETVLVPEVLLRRIVQNLLTNAIKFTTQGEVRLKVEGRQIGQNAHLMISVVDSGEGLDPGIQDSLFERGVQGARTDSGFGLGLSVCRELVEGLGGKIGAENLANGGSRFWFKLKLPVVQEKPSAVILPAEEMEAPKPKILVADDDVMAQKLVRRLLAQMGFGVELVTNGHDALVAMMNQDFEAVIMDCDMPIMDGFEATRLIREKESKSTRSHNTPIIALTGHAQAEDREAFQNAGATAHVSKPVALSELESILREHLSHRLEAQHADS